METPMNKEKVIVFKDRESRAIETYVNLGGHGARTGLDTFISLLAEAYGNPMVTFTVKSHEAALKVAAAEVVRHLKQQTRAIAAAQFP